MARIARVVVPGVPHHVTQRGNRREPIFSGDGDYRLYRRLVAEAAAKAGAQVWAYRRAGRRRRPAGDAGRGAPALCGEDQRPFGWTGHLFQGRFGAAAMDEDHLLAAARYVALNPVAAGLVRRARTGRGRARGRS